jgi:hypothetical protein
VLRAFVHIRKQDTMKKYLLSTTIIFFAACSFAQTGFGFDVGYATSKSALIDFKYFLNENAFSVGFTYQSSNALGKKVTQRMANFIIGDGDFYYSVDIGYTRLLSEKFSIEAEVSIGQRSFYTNYNDNANGDGGYHMIDKKKSVVGAGGIITYSLSDIFGFFAGYNSLREAAAGLQIKFVK